MTLPQDADCDDCTPAYLKQSQFGTKAAVSTLPFILTFIITTLIAYRRVHPLLSDPRTSQPLARRIAALTFSSTIALSTVLTELLLCEISNSFNPTARSIALQITVTTLLGLLVIAIPLLGIYSVVSKSGYRLDSSSKSRRLAWLFEATGYLIFLAIFWTIGTWLPQTDNKHTQNLLQACLDRLGITGVALMALLSGFASVSAIWANFGPKQKLVNEPDITRKQTGLDTTLDMIREKRARLRFVEGHIAATPTKGWISGMMSTFRGNTETQEKQTLEMEIQGLETMSGSLSSALTIMKQRYTDQQRSSTTLGRAFLAFQYSFSIYCIYRICTTSITITRRIFSKSRTSDSDPVTYAIALFARHVYPNLDQEGWTQQISFLLSGVMLLASFSAVTQTFHLFERVMPGAVRATRTNFALLISQVSGMYVISSALMLRGMMPKEVGSVINGALGSGMLDPAWLQKWFDGFFMTSVLVTVIGVVLSRKVGGSVLDDSWDGDIEMGKRS